MTPRLLTINTLINKPNEPNNIIHAKVNHYPCFCLCSTHIKWIGSGYTIHRVPKTRGVEVTTLAMFIILWGVPFDVVISSNPYEWLIYLVTPKPLYRFI